MTLETAKFLCWWKAHDSQETSPRSLSRTMNSSSSVHGGGKRRVGEHAAFLAACYTIWHNDGRFIYVGMSGRGITAAASKSGGR